MKIDETLNPWIGKHRDEQVKAIGSPTQCTTLRDGGSVCDWRDQGSHGVACPPDPVYGGHRCNGGGSWEHHVIFTYDAAGFAREWVYRGEWGKRTSQDAAHEAQARAASIANSAAREAEAMSKVLEREGNQ
ncbi:MAG: hypothetical protein M3Z35_06690 [Nitrospirota bacterium]|nr:hypothetical protein [Nitrospirota bacterium]